MYKASDQRSASTVEPPPLRHKTICSVAPREFTTSPPFPHRHEYIDPDTGERLLSNFKTYDIEAAVPVEDGGTGYVTLNVFDAAVIIRDTQVMDGEAHKEAPVFCESISQDLVDRWAGDMPGSESGFTIGLAIIEGDEPTKDELAHLNAIQTGYAQYMVNQGSEFFNTGQSHNISTLHRDMAAWLGAENVPWYVEVKRMAMKSCLACGKKILAHALVCEHCSTILTKFAYDQIEDDEMEIDELAQIDPTIGLRVGRKLQKQRDREAGRTVNRDEVDVEEFADTVTPAEAISNGETEEERRERAKRNRQEGAKRARAAKEAIRVG